MCEHIVVSRKLGVRCVEVEAGASAKVPVSIFAIDAGAAGGGVGEEERDALGGGGSKESAFLRSAQGQSRERRGKMRSTRYPQCKSVQQGRQGAGLCSTLPGVGERD